MNNNPSTLRTSWKKEMQWILTDDSSENSRTAAYDAEHVFELLSKNIFQTTERDDFKRLSVALSDYLKMVEFSEEIGQLQMIALSVAFGYYYRKLEEKHIVRVEEKSSDVKEPNKSSAPIQTSTANI